MTETESMHDYVVERLQATKGSWTQIAKRSRVPKRTLEKIATRETADPRIKTIEKLFVCFGGRGLIVVDRDRGRRRKDQHVTS